MKESTLLKTDARDAICNNENEMRDVAGVTVANDAGIKDSKTDT